VECVTGSGTDIEPFRARSAIITVPHAVLKAKAITFRPALSETEGAIQRLEAGQVLKAVLQFRSAFWFEDAFMKQRLEKKASFSGKLGFVHSQSSDVP